MKYLGYITVIRIQQHHSPVIVQDLSKHARMSVEEVFVQHRVVVGQRLGQPAQSRGGYFLEGRFVGLVPDATDVQHHPVLGVYVQYVHHSARAAGASRRLRLMTTYHVNLNITKPLQPPFNVTLGRAPITEVAILLRPTNLNMAFSCLQWNPDAPRPWTVSSTRQSSTPF